MNKKTTTLLTVTLGLSLLGNSNYFKNTKITTNEIELPDYNCEKIVHIAADKFAEKKSDEMYVVINQIMNRKRIENKKKIYAVSISRGNVSRIVFDVNNLRKTSNVSEEKINEIINGTGLEGLGKAFIEAQDRYGVNAVFLVAVSALESGWGESKIAHNKNNLFGFKAYDSSPFKSAKYFNSKEDCILYFAEYLSDNYLTKDGRYYSGLSVYNVHRWNSGKCKYSSDEKWAQKIIKIMNKFK